MTASVRTLLGGRFLKPNMSFIACQNYSQSVQCKKLFIEEYGDPLKVVKKTVVEINGPKEDEVGFHFIILLTLLILLSCNS